MIDAEKYAFTIVSVLPDNPLYLILYLEAKL